jgi:hypothetical protein
MLLAEYASYVTVVPALTTTNARSPGTCPLLQVLASDQAPDLTEETLEPLATVTLTVLDPSTAPLFARALALTVCTPSAVLVVSQL